MSTTPFFTINDTGTWVLEVEDDGTLQDLTASGHNVSAVVAQLQLPDLTFTTWTATLGTAVHEVDITLGTLSVGAWKLMLKLTMPAKVRHTRVIDFRVYDELA